MSRSAPWFIVVLVLAGLFLVRETRDPGALLAEGDNRFLDWLMANAQASGPKTASPSAVTLVEIDDTMLDKPSKWPLSALDYALFLQAADHFDASVVGIVPVLSWPRERQQPEYERILLDVAPHTPKLLLGVQAAEVTVTRSSAEEPELEERELSALASQGLPASAAANLIVQRLRHIRGDATGLPELPDLARRPGEPLLLTGTPGPADVPAAPGGITRTVPLLFRCQGDVLPSFVLQAAMLWMQLTPDEISVELGAYVQMGNKVRIPIDQTGAFRVDFQLAPQLPRLSLDDLLLAANNQQGGGATPRASGAAGSQSAAEAVQGPPAASVLLLGRTDKAARTLRLPTVHAGSRAEIFALALEGIQRRAFIRRVPVSYDFIVIGVLAVLGWSFLPLPRASALLMTGAFWLVYTLIALAIFEMGRLWLPWVLPTGMLAVTAVLHGASGGGERKGA